MKILLQEFMPNYEECSCCYLVNMHYTLHGCSHECTHVLDLMGLLDMKQCTCTCQEGPEWTSSSTHLPFLHVPMTTYFVPMITVSTIQWEWTILCYWMYFPYQIMLGKYIPVGEAHQHNYTISAILPQIHVAIYVVLRNGVVPKHAL